MPVLITAGLSPEAYRLKRILNITDIILADDSPLPQIPGNKSLVIPSYRSPSFIHEVLKACLDLGITRIYPLKRGEVIELSKARSLYLEYNIILIIPTENWLGNINDKIEDKGVNITVLENGKLAAGSAFPQNFSIDDETGIFTWATRQEKTEYCLYLVEDAGI